MTVSENAEILLVEDNPFDAELTLKVLNDSKIANKILWIKDGETALDYVFARGPYESRDIACLPKMILLDLNLPKMDGIEVLRRIKSDARTKDIHVIVITTSLAECDMLETYKLGINCYMPKPIDSDKFIKVISELGFHWLIVSKPS